MSDVRQGRTPQQEFIEFQLDPIRILFKNAEEEYGQYLAEYEAQFGAKAREEYEEKYV